MVYWSKQVGTLRVLLSLPTQEHLSPVETACIKLPVVPSSLFGGRFQMALASLRQGVSLREGCDQAIRDNSQGSLPAQAQTAQSGGKSNTRKRKLKQTTSTGTSISTTSSANPSGGQASFRDKQKKQKLQPKYVPKKQKQRSKKDKGGKGGGRGGKDGAKGQGDTQ